MHPQIFCGGEFCFEWIGARKTSIHKCMDTYLYLPIYLYYIYHHQVATFCKNANSRILMIRRQLCALLTTSNASADAK